MRVHLLRLSAVSGFLIGTLCAPSLAQDAPAEQPWRVVCTDASRAEADGEEAEAESAEAAAAAATEEGDGSRCVIRQRLVRKEGGQQVLFAGLRPAEDGGGVMRVVLPLGSDLREGLALLVDGASLKTGTARTCLPGGCVYIVPLTSEEIGRLKRGTRMGVAVRALNGRGVAWPVSLSGFTAAFDEALAGGTEE